ncbi:hypothetical protein BKA65DRAFT_490304 [Rhexocercosporidium sp. MPI-PUGE-AT-0058]|nr:hypothetical protein BKA65DRAFT_490304 [Rhexocercosporidium sp. MPI-PUGE-AT-0058]
MRFSIASLVVFSTIMIGPVLAEELDSKDVPTACTTICKPIVDLTSTCDVDNDTDKTESDDAIEATCICSNTSFNVASIAALCASCISQNGATTDGTCLLLFFPRTLLIKLPRYAANFVCVLFHIYVVCALSNRACRCCHCICD